MPARTYRWWILTIPEEDFEGRDYEIKDSLVYLRGQLEEAASGFRHWQIVAYFNRKLGVRGVKSYFCERSHCEPTRSGAAREYVWKEETRVEGTQFELGQEPVRRQEKADWDKVWENAKTGDFLAIPAPIRVQNYGNLRRIASDYSVTIGMERSCVLFVGPTGTGKSRRAWEEAGMDAYSKGRIVLIVDPRSKFWDGYRGQKHVVIDEFRGSIDIAHLLRWFDRYPVRVEIKGSSTPLLAVKFWITSNISIEEWWSDLDSLTLDALKRRIEVINFS
jgi:hypothetical protein